MTVKLTRWQRGAAYGLFGLLAFAFALRQTLPADAVRDRLVMEAAAQGWQVTIADVGPAGLVGVSMRSVVLESRDGVRIPVERLDATLRPWALLLGRRSFGFDAELFGGRVRGYVEQGRGARRLVAAVTGLDLARAAALRKATGLELAGVLQGDVDVALDEREPGKSAGRVDLAVDKAVLNGGAVPVPGMAGTLTVPRIGLGQVTARGGVKDGRLAFEQLEAKGEDLQASTEGLYLVLQPRLAYAPIFGKARLKFAEAFWGKPGASGFKPIAEVALAQAKGRDGAYGFQIFGTVSQPQARMAP